MNWLVYTVSTLYTLSILVVTGLVFIESYIAAGLSPSFRSFIQDKRSFFTKALFVLTLVSIFEQLIQWLDQFGKKIDLPALFFNTISGQVWIAILLLSIVGLFIYKKSSLFLLVWSFLLLLFESMDGHISGLEAFSLGMLSDFVHLLCGAIWVAGIVLFAISYKNFKDELLQLMKRFMKLIWLTILLLAISGTMLAVLLLPSWHYLFYTTWGLMLLLKVLLVFAAIFCGYKVREHISRKTLPHSKLLWTEAGILLAVILLASTISLLSPSPNTTPLNVHKMGEELHYTVKLNPNAAGPNQFSLTLWTLEEDGEVANVEVEMYAVDKPERSAISFQPMQVEELDDVFEFAGFMETRYTFEDLELPYPTKWNVAAKITFESGEAREFSFKFENK